MRKLYWGFAAAGLAAVGLLHGANYACRHPETIAGRCAIAMYHAGLTLCPLCRAGTYLVDRIGVSPEDPQDVLEEIPEDPEPVAVGEPSSAVPEEDHASGTLRDEDRGRLPGKIVIDDGDEPPIAQPEHEIAPEPNLGRFLERFEVEWTSDERTNSEVTTAFWKTPAGPVREMPCCADDDSPPTMPYADEPAPTPRKSAPPRIWNPFPPKGTEVGEPELNPNGNDCREDAAASVQIPGCPSPAPCNNSKATTEGGSEEASEPPPAEKKKSKRADPPASKRSFDASKLTPFAAPVKLDTMEFRPSDWGKDDVALPPF